MVRKRQGVPRVRRTQSQRSAETRGKLLDAAERCLVELGYWGTSTSEVCRRADVSNGSLLHHYGTRERLMAATLERLYERRTAEVLAALDAAERSRDRVRVLVERMSQAFEQDDYKVIVELWVATANDAGLRRRVLPVMQAFDATLRPTAARLFPPAARRRRRFAAAIGLLFNFMQGMGLARIAFGSDSTTSEQEAAERELLVQALSPVFGET